MKRFKCLTLIFLLISACSPGGVSTPLASPKSLFSVWKKSDSSTGFDLTGKAIGISNVIFTLYQTGGQKCSTTLNLTGTEPSGNYTISGSTYVESTGVPAFNPGCLNLNDSGTFTKTDTVLNLCSNGTTCRAWQ